MIETLPPWFTTAAAVLATASVVLGILGTFALPLAIVRLPTDALVAPRPVHHGPAWILRQVVGAVVIGAGVAMLVLPGQGILTILLGLAITDLPLRRRLVAVLVARPTVRRAVDAMRTRAGAEPMAWPDDVDRA